MVIICVVFWFFVVVVVGVFHLERVSLLCINFEQPLVPRGKRLNLLFCEKGYGKLWSCSTEGGGLREKTED